MPTHNRLFLLEYISSSLPYYPWPPLCSVEGAFTTAVHEKTPKSYILRTAQWHPAMTWTRENCSSEGDGEGEGGAANKGRRETGRVFALHDPLESIIVVRWCSIAHTHTRMHSHATPLLPKQRAQLPFFLCCLPGGNLYNPSTTLNYIALYYKTTLLAVPYRAYLTPFIESCVQYLTVCIMYVRTPTCSVCRTYCMYKRCLLTRVQYWFVHKQ